MGFFDKRKEIKTLKEELKTTQTELNDTREKYINCRADYEGLMSYIDKLTHILNVKDKIDSNIRINNYGSFVKLYSEIIRNMIKFYNEDKTAPLIEKLEKLKKRNRCLEEITVNGALIKENERLRTQLNETKRVLADERARYCKIMGEKDE